MTSIAIIPGPVRPVRADEQAVCWIEEQARQANGVQTVFFDLHDYRLPPFAKEMSPLMQAPELSEVVRLCMSIEANDAATFVTPEYSHSVPVALKNAIDYLPLAALKGKAVGLVGYSWHGTVKPSEYLREIVSILGAEIRE